MKPIPNPYRTGECFFCGEQNPIGLRLDFFESETEPREVVLNWHAFRAAYLMKLWDGPRFTSLKAQA